MTSERQPPLTLVTEPTDVNLMFAAHTTHRLSVPKAMKREGYDYFSGVELTAPHPLYLVSLSVSNAVDAPPREYLLARTFDLMALMERFTPASIRRIQVAEFAHRRLPYHWKIESIVRLWLGSDVDGVRVVIYENEVGEFWCDRESGGDAHNVAESEVIWQRPEDLRARRRAEITWR